jgi:hypothetical protein
MGLLEFGFRMTVKAVTYLFLEDVIHATAEQADHFLAASGELIEEIARRSFQHGKKTSRPGERPVSHTAQIENLIYYALDPTDLNAVKLVHGVAIGPIHTDGGEDAPAVLEHGGTAQLPAYARRNMDRTRSILTSKPFRKFEAARTRVERVKEKWKRKKVQKHGARDLQEAVGVARGIVRDAAEHVGRLKKGQRLEEVRAGPEREVRIEPRPFMGPALEEAMSHLASLWPQN